MKTSQLMDIDYFKTFENSLRAWGENRNRDNTKKVIFGFIKFYARLNRENYFDGMEKEKLIMTFQSFSAMDRVIEELTIREFMQIFPPEKKFDGAKHEVIDYYSTMEHIEELGGIDTLIADVGAREFIASYYNVDIFNYNIASMLLMSAIQVSEGKPTIAEEFMTDMQRENTVYRGRNGIEFKQNRDGTFQKVGKGHLRLLN